MSFPKFANVFRSQPTFDERLQQAGNRPSGFDYMRIILAVSVVLWHAQWLAAAHNAYSTLVVILTPLAWSIVPMFFALSGFLVAGSLDRSETLFNYLGLRILRIMPALTVEILFSALILGPLLTTLPLASYFSSHQFYRYFLNLLGILQYNLPGVFDHNPDPSVNGQLWTVGYEMVSYIFLAALAVLGIYQRKAMLLFVLGAYYMAQLANSILRGHTEMTGPTASTIVMAFVAGLVIHQYRNQIYWSGYLCIISALVIFIMLCVPNGSRFVALPIAYVVIYLGLLNPPRHKIILSGDYSYAIYLYSFPVQQALIALSPIFLVWYINSLIALPVVLLLAVGSWWFVEKPALNMRDKLKVIEKHYLNLKIDLPARLYRNAPVD